MATAPLVPLGDRDGHRARRRRRRHQRAGGGRLASAATFQFTVAAGSTLRLQQLLAQLGYLPVTFTPAGPLSAPQEAAQPQEGTFAWRWTEPASLVALWTPGHVQRHHHGSGHGVRDRSTA